MRYFLKKKTDTSDFVVKRDAHAHTKKRKHIQIYWIHFIEVAQLKKANKCQLECDESPKTD